MSHKYETAAHCAGDILQSAPGRRALHMGRRITMAYENSMNMQAPHRVSLDEREVLSVSGVEEVERFDENEIVMATVRGTLVVRGEGLHIEKLSLDGGELKVEGGVDSLVYEDDGRNDRGGFFARLFR